jgi:hypothetical protein
MSLDHVRIIEARPPRAGAAINFERIRYIGGGAPVLARRLWPIDVLHRSAAGGGHFRKAGDVHVAACRCPDDVFEHEAHAFFAKVIMAYLQFYRIDGNGQRGLRIDFFCDGQKAVGERDGGSGRQNEAVRVTFIFRPQSHFPIVVLHYRNAAGHARHRHGFILSVGVASQTVAEGVAAANAIPEAPTGSEALA